MTDRSRRRRAITILGWGLALLAILALAISAGAWYLNSLRTEFFDVDFVADHSVGEFQVGVALRHSRAGLFGDARRYVVVVRDRQGQRVDTLYEGPGGYLDSPYKPRFLSGDDASVTYDTDGTHPQTFLIGRRGRDPADM